MNNARKPSVGVVCSTYRNPEQDSLVRLYGVVSLFDQMMNQNYGGDIKIALVDDSPEPHPFYQEMQKAYPDKVVYLHLPSRNAVDETLCAQFPKALSFMPSDETLKAAYALDIADRAAQGKPIRAAEQKLLHGDFNLSKEEWDQVINRKPGGLLDADAAEGLKASFNAYAKGDAHTRFWLDRIRQVRSYARFMPFDRDYPIQPNILTPLFGDRPTIGMKKNIGVQALAEAFGEYDTIVFCDDDDHHAPDYVAQSVAALGDADFTRMTRYITHVHNKDAAKSSWGIFDLQIEKDDNGYWVLPAEEEDRPFKMMAKEGIIESKLGDKFSRPVTVAWPILSHEGALHTYSFDIWKKSLPHCGGAIPVSFAEDLFLYRELKNHFGKDFTDTKTEIAPGQEQFIRITDGTNASLVEWTEELDAAALPEWCKAATALLKKAAALDLKRECHAEILGALGRAYGASGKLDMSLVRDRPADRPTMTPAPGL
ncbi:MAG: hypothetical protein ACXW4B_11745 [Micavibrio sp.]